MEQIKDEIGLSDWGNRENVQDNRVDIENQHSENGSEVSRGMPVAFSVQNSLIS